MQEVQVVYVPAQVAQLIEQSTHVIPLATVVSARHELRHWLLYRYSVPVQLKHVVAVLTHVAQESEQLVHTIPFW